MKIKKESTYTIIGFIIIFSIPYSYNIYTFLGIIKNPEYCIGKVYSINYEGKNKYPYSYYQYEVKGIKHTGKQGGIYSTNENFIIVFNKENPKYSMITNYSEDINTNININPKSVSFSWWDYLPDK